MDVFECPFSFHAHKHPNQVALISPLGKWTYRHCHHLIDCLAQSLKTKGIQSGDCVGLYPTKTALVPLIFFALFRLGAIVYPLNTHLHLSTIPQNLNAAGATIFLHPDKLQPPQMQQPSLSFSQLSLNHCPLTNRHFFKKEKKSTYLLTSGTTNSPKIASFSHGNHYYSALGSNAHLPLRRGDRWLLSLPLYHISGIAILFRSFLAGAAVVLTEESPTAEILLHLKVTHLSFVPTQLHRLIEGKKTPLMQLSRQLKSLLLGGDFIPHHLYKKGLERELKIHPTYGMTEMSSQITTETDPTAPSFSLGHPLPYRALKISKDREVLVRGKTLFQGYLNLKKDLELPLDDQGWFKTYDLGEYSIKKGLSILGRKDRLFISGGENIHPEEIERILKNIQGIIDARVDAIPDPEFGHRPIAYIKSEEPFKEEELKEYLSSFLPKYKIPIAFFPTSKEKPSPSFYRE